METQREPPAAPSRAARPREAPLPSGQLGGAPGWAAGRGGEVKHLGNPGLCKEHSAGCCREELALLNLQP